MSFDEKRTVVVAKKVSGFKGADAGKVSRQTLIGSGNQGFLFRPALACDRPSISCNPRYVMKVMPFELAGVEKSLCSSIERVDPEHNRFLTFVPGFEHKLTSDQTQQLSTIVPTVKPKDDQKWLGYAIRYGGLTYKTRLQSFMNEDWLEMSKDLMFLLESLQVLHEADIVHRDLKSTNVLYHPSSGQLRIIDFGLAVSLRDCTLESLLMRLGDCKFVIWSMELNAKCSELRQPALLWHWLQTTARPWSMWLNLWSMENPTGIVSSNVSAVPPPGQWYTKYLQDSSSFWTHLEKEPKTDAKTAEAFKQTIAHMLKQNDVFQLGLMYADFTINQYLTQSGGSSLPRREHLMQFIDKVLLPMIHPDFRVRLTPLQAIHRIKELLLGVQSTTLTDAERSPSDSISSSISSTSSSFASSSASTSCYASKNVWLDKASHLKATPANSEYLHIPAPKKRTHTRAKGSGSAHGSLGSDIVPRPSKRKKLSEPTQSAMDHREN